MKTVIPCKIQDLSFTPTDTFLKFEYYIYVLQTGFRNLIQTSSEIRENIYHAIDCAWCASMTVIELCSIFYLDLKKIRDEEGELIYQYLSSISKVKVEDLMSSNDLFFIPSCNFKMKKFMVILSDLYLMSLKLSYALAPHLSYDLLSVLNIISRVCKLE